MITNNRILAVDAARGCAIVMVCASHINFQLHASSTLLGWLFMMTTRVATPTFLLLSGFIVGHLLRTRRNIGLSIIDRGLFLLLIAHFTLGVYDIDLYGVAEWAFARTTITDAIGLSLCVAVLLCRRSPSQLALVGVGLCLIAWYAALTLGPGSGWSAILASVLFSTGTANHPIIYAALVPYLGVFVLGMALSGHLHGALVAGDGALIARKLLALAISAIVVVGMGILAYKIAENTIPIAIVESDLKAAVQRTLDPRNKQPPSPGYFLTYGGVGLVMLGIFFAPRLASLTRLVGPHAALIGRASLLCYIVQDWLFLVVPHVFGFRSIVSTPFWLGYLTAVILFLYMLSRWWCGINGNRFFTVGLRALGKRARHRRNIVTDAGTTAAESSAIRKTGAMYQPPRFGQNR